MQQMPTPDYYDDIDMTLDESWRLMETGAEGGHPGFQIMQLATVGLNGAPTVRSVVLRHADRAGRTVRFHTEKSTAKVPELNANPAVALHFYCASENVQLRLAGEAVIEHQGPIADAAWNATKPTSRASYASVPVQGQAIEAGGAFNAVYDPECPDNGRSAFCAVTVTVSRLEWLYLHAAGQRRARFVWTGQAWQGQWLVP